MEVSGRVISPIELDRAAIEIINNCEDKIAELMRVERALCDFLEEHNLQGNAWQGLKNQMSDYYAIVVKFIMAYHDTISEAEALRVAVSGERETLIEEHIRYSILSYTNLIANLERQIRELDAIAQMSCFYGMNSIVRSTGVYARAIRTAETAITELNAKLETLERIDNATRGLFENINLTFDSVNSGIRSIGKAWNGSSFVRSGTGEWSVGAIENWNQRWADMIDDFIIGIREMGIPFPDGWSEDDINAFAWRYFKEMRLLHEFMEINFTTRDFRVDYNVARDAQTAFLFLSGIELAFHLTFEQRLELIQVVRDANGWIAPIEETLLGMGLSVTNENRIKLGDAIPGIPIVGNVRIGIGDLLWLANTANETYVSAKMGTTFHDRFTFLASISFLEMAGRMGHVGQTPRLPNVPNPPPVRGMDSWKTSGKKPPPPPPPVRGTGGPRPIIGNSYDINKLIRTQPYVRASNVTAIKEAIKTGGPNAVPPIKIHVHNGRVYVVDGHHRLEAFRQLGYTRVPISYVRKQHLGTIRPDGSYYRPLNEILGGAEISN